jgi:hypothetical protein
LHLSKRPIALLAFKWLYKRAKLWHDGFAIKQGEHILMQWYLRPSAIKGPANEIMVKLSEHNAVNLESALKLGLISSRLAQAIEQEALAS